MSLDIESLLRDISPDKPSGESFEGRPEFVDFEKKRQGTPEDILGNPGKDPNWREVRNDGIKLLGQTHDLRIVLPLIQALIHTDGLSGLLDGLGLLQNLIERYWDSLYPLLDAEDNNDPTERMILLGTLSQSEPVLLPVSKAPIVESPKLGRYCFRDFQIATGKLPAPKQSENLPPLATIEAAFTDSDLEGLKASNQIVNASVDALSNIEAFLLDRVGAGNAPNLMPLRDLLKEMRHLLGDQLARRGVTEAVTAEAIEAPQAAPSQIAGAALGAVNNRGDVIRALDLICEYYARNEPSSPVPLLLMRAKRLASKDFLEIMQELAPAGLDQIKVIAGADIP